MRAQAAIPAQPVRSSRQSVRLLLLVFVQYGLLATDIRFVAQGYYTGVAIVNVCIAITTWYLTKGLIEARTVTDRMCFVLGGAAGALFAVYVT